MFDDSDRPLDPGGPSPPEGVPEARPVHTQGEPEASPPQAQDQPEPSPAQTRLRACRWHTEADDQQYCSNRDVLPYAGKGGFDPEAWCPDCTLYKLRRTPKKRSHLEDDYPY